MASRKKNDIVRRQLLELARLCGIEGSYQDVQGKRHNASDETLLALLPALGVAIDNTADVDSALLDRVCAVWRRVLDPVTVVWDGGPCQISIRLPITCENDDVAWRIDLENQEIKVGAFHVSALPDQKSSKIQGEAYSEKQFALPSSIPLGYHWFSLEIRGQEYKSLIIAAPTRAFVPSGNGWERSWGVFLPLHALNSRQSLGAGDFGDLKSLNQWAHSLGASFVGTLPLLAAFLDEPFEISPYSPASRLFWNEFYLNISQVPELRLAPSARELLESAHTLAELESLRSCSLVDYRRIMAVKRPVLEKLAESFFSVASDRRGDFESFVSQRPRLDSYAAFRAVGERLRLPWQKWDGPLRGGLIHPTEYSHDAKRFHMYVQWLAHEQLKEAAGKVFGGGLYTDLPLGVSRFGYDVWSERDSFANGVTGGCPPDIVFPQGQNWGFVPLHPEGIRNNYYTYVRDCVRHQLSIAKVLRIDHMPSFHRVFWIPPSMSASEGAYVRYHAEEMYAVFCLESRRHCAMLVGEDLGTVPPEVPESMRRHNFHRMHVIQYELKPDATDALPAAPSASLASLNTHDMPPFAGFWGGHDLHERREAGLLVSDKITDESRARSKLRESLRRYLKSQELVSEESDLEDIFRGCVAHLRDGPARMVLINLEDVWLETRSQNMPSASGDTANWRRKARHSLEEFTSDSKVLNQLLELSKGLNCSRQTAESTSCTLPHYSDAASAADPSSPD